MPADPPERKRGLTDDERDELARRLCAHLYDLWQRRVREADNPSADPSDPVVQYVREWRARRPPPPGPTAPLTEDEVRRRPRYRGSRRRP